MDWALLYFGFLRQTYVSAGVGLACAAQFSADDKWYRAKVVDLGPSGVVTVFYVDYGNSESLPLDSICKLLHRFLTLPAQVSSIDNSSA